MGTEYNIANLFLEAFGLKVRDSYSLNVEEKPKAISKLFEGIKIIEDPNEAYEMSAFGTPIIHPIDFLEGSYKKYNDKGEIVVKKMGNFRLPIASVISLSRKKIMTKTPINGGRGSVKEIYGFDDWQITINGFLIPDPTQPQRFFRIDQQEHELSKWDNLASSVEVSCNYLIQKSINYITIDDISFSPMRGRPNIRAFTVSATSDSPIELNIKSEV